ncbi:hypothetical protein [Streptosporangium sp. NPDC002524]
MSLPAQASASVIPEIEARSGQHVAVAATAPAQIRARTRDGRARRAGGRT